MAVLPFCGPDDHEDDLKTTGVVHNLEKTTLSTPPPVLNEHFSVDTFVSPKVKPSDQAKTYLRQMVRYYPRKCWVVGAHLNRQQRTWKLDWHWEMLLSMMKIALQLGTSAPQRTEIETMMRRLRMVAPTPGQGYVDSDNTNDPIDKSGTVQVDQRYAVVLDCKRRFERIVARALLHCQPLPMNADVPRNILTVIKQEFWQHAINTIDHPEKTRHRHHFTFDIGAVNKDADNTQELRKRIEDVSLALGCGFHNDEGSHVHVEFPAGIKG